MISAIAIAIACSLLVVLTAGGGHLPSGGVAVVLDANSNPTGRVIDQPGFWWIGLTRSLAFYDKRPSAMEGQVVAVDPAGVNYRVDYRFVHQSFPSSLLPTLFDKGVFGAHGTTEIYECAVAGSVAEWVSQGRPETDLGSRAAARVKAELAARGVDGGDVPAITVTLIAVERVSDSWPAFSSGAGLLSLRPRSAPCSTTSAT